MKVRVKPTSTKGHDKAGLGAGRAGAAVPLAAPHKGVPVHATLCKSDQQSSSTWPGHIWLSWKAHRVSIA